MPLECQACREWGFVPSRHPFPSSVAPSASSYSWLLLPVAAFFKSHNRSGTSWETFRTKFVWGFVASNSTQSLFETLPQHYLGKPWHGLAPDQPSTVLIPEPPHQAGAIWATLDLLAGFPAWAAPWGASSRSSVKSDWKGSCCFGSVNRWEVHIQNLTYLPNLCFIMVGGAPTWGQPSPALVGWTESI